MAQVSFTDLVNGVVPDASDFNTRYNALKDRLNNGVEGDNIAAASISTAKIVNGAVTNDKITSVAVGKITGVLPVANGGTGLTAAVNAASGVVALDASSKLPAVDGSLLTGLPAPTLFGSYEFKTPGTVYLAATDGIVFANAGFSGGGGTSTIKVGDNNPPTTTIVAVASTYLTYGMSAAVKKGQYYLAKADSGQTTVDQVCFMPLGS